MAGKKNVSNPNEQRKTTPKKYTHAASDKTSEGGGQYPNYSSTKYRDGSNEITDNSNGNEFSIWQHRSGTTVELQADGSLHVTASNSHYKMVFGENRVTVTGANDLHIKGDGSMRVYGDYNKTVHGNVNMTITGDYNVTAQNLNRNIRGNIDTQAKNKTDKVEGSVSVQAQGAIAHVAEGSYTAASHGDQVHVGGAKGLNLAVANQGDITINNENGNLKANMKQGTIEANADKAIKIASGDSFNVQAVNTNMKTTQKIAFEAGSDITNKAGGVFAADATSKIDWQGGSSQSVTPEQPEAGAGNATQAASADKEGSSSDANGNLA